jgi:hypothetical protein
LGSPDVVIAATAYADVVPALKSLGDLTGKVVVDITNPLTPDYMGLTVGHSTSAAEEIAKAVPGAQVVKAFNTVFAQILADGPELQGKRVPVFYATDRKQAGETVRVLIESTGFAPVNAGPLKNARYLEPVAGLNIASVTVRSMAQALRLLGSGSSKCPNQAFELSGERT